MRRSRPSGRVAEVPAPPAPVMASERPTHNLPAPLTSFIGRQREIAELARLLPSTRLLTLTGAGGCGKTRLALEVARQVLDGFPDGVWLVDLAPLAEPSLVAQTVASVLDVRQAPNRSLVETLADQLRHRRMLLLLDNCEHVIARAPRSSPTTLLRAAAGLTILATSREALGIAGETTWRVPSLTLPDPPARWSPPTISCSTRPSICWSSERRPLRRGFTITSDNAGTVADVCRRLDGIPLAIELAAARLNVLSIEQIHARLDDRFRLLARTEPDADRTAANAGSDRRLELRPALGRRTPAAAAALDVRRRVDARRRRARVRRRRNRPHRRARPDVPPGRQVARHRRRRSSMDTAGIGSSRRVRQYGRERLQRVRRGGRRARPSLRVLPRTGPTRRAGTDEGGATALARSPPVWSTTIFERRWSGVWPSDRPGPDEPGAGGGVCTGSG